MLSPEHRALIDSVQARYLSDQIPDRDTERAVVAAILANLAEREPGRSVEVRIPPYAAIQVVAGHTHRRGTPSAVVETTARTLVALATGSVTWAQASASGALQASGERSDLSHLFPLT
ncbi:MAG: hypothetical protein K9G12_05305 [Candidatus Nanopelagicales bacterium]|nr:hypothetical protein [Candidatus Nanopelagicales bacterium]